MKLVLILLSSLSFKVYSDSLSLRDVRKLINELEDLKVNKIELTKKSATDNTKRIPTNLESVFEKLKKENSEKL